MGSSLVSARLPSAPKTTIVVSWSPGTGESSERGSRASLSSSSESESPASFFFSVAVAKSCFTGELGLVMRSVVELDAVYDAERRRNAPRWVVGCDFCEGDVCDSCAGGLLLATTMLASDEEDSKSCCRRRRI